MSKATEKPTRGLKLFILSPARTMCRFRDAYIRGMTGCANHVHAASVGFVYSGPFPNELPRSSSLDSTDRWISSRADDEKLRQLFQATELRRPRSLGNGHKLEGGQAVARSKRTMEITRIDEDRTCEFEEDAKAGLDQFLIPRSRSFAVASMRRPARMHA